MEKKTLSGCEALEVIVRRIVVPTGAATVEGLSEPSAFAVNAAGRTAEPAPLEDGIELVVLVERAGADWVCAGALGLEVDL